MFKYLVPEADRNKPLAKLIEQVRESNAFSKHLGNLSDVVRQGGNLGAHFDERREPDQLLAHQIVELTDYLAAYLYTLLSKIEKLEHAIKGAP